MTVTADAVNAKGQVNQMGRMQRAKGARGERELARALTRALKVEPGTIYRSVQHAGREGAGDVLGVEGLHIECKRCEALSVYKAMDQAQAECGKDVPVVFHKRNLREWLCICELHDVVEFARTIIAIVDDKKERTDE